MTNNLLHPTNQKQAKRAFTVRKKDVLTCFCLTGAYFHVEFPDVGQVGYQETVCEPIRIWKFMITVWSFNCILESF